MKQVSFKFKFNIHRQVTLNSTHLAYNNCIQAKPIKQLLLCILE